MNRKPWHEKIAYQIYPKSFRDSNGDGIGDIPGIIEKLDELKELGIDMLWLSPVYCSPLADQGYDISDYYDIDPRFGTLEDVRTLLREAKKRNMDILMDLVVNHCSDEHEWFRKACEDPYGPYGQFFYIKPWHEGEPLPTNWRSYFGGSVWEKLPGHDDLVYMHLFHKKQPDLNWENPALRTEVYKMINWWIEQGVNGFRLDAIINIKKALPMHDYPADREDGLASVDWMLEEADGVLDFLNEMAAETFHKHDAFTIAELFNDAPGELENYIGENGCFSSMFNFEEAKLSASGKGWYDAKPVTPDDYKHGIFFAQEKYAGDCMAANLIENHDQPRGVSHYLPEGECSEAGKKLLAGILFMRRGLPFLYQGQELGMENTCFASIDQVDDISTVDQYQVALAAGLTEEEALRAVEKISRDNARTPYQWDATEQAGFTTGKPWLPVNPNYKRINLAAQKADPDSVYHFYRKLIALRKDPSYHETLVWGDFVPYLPEQHNLIAFRRTGDRELLILANFQKEAQTVRLPGTVRKVLLDNGVPAVISGDTVEMPGYQFLVLELAE